MFCDVSPEARGGFKMVLTMRTNIHPSRFIIYISFFSVNKFTMSISTPQFLNVGNDRGLPTMRVRPSPEKADTNRQFPIILAGARMDYG